MYFFILLFVVCLQNLFFVLFCFRLCLFCVSFVGCLQSSVDYAFSITREDLDSNNQNAALGNLGGNYHCRICDTKFGTGIDRSFLSQFKAHSKSKVHNEHKAKLLKQMVCERMD